MRPVRGSRRISVTFSTGSKPRVGSRKRHTWRLTSNSILPMNLLRACEGFSILFPVASSFPDLARQETALRYFRVYVLSPRERSPSSERGRFSAPLEALPLFLDDLREPRRSKANAAPATMKQNAPMVKVTGSRMRIPPAAATAGVHHKA